MDAVDADEDAAYEAFPDELRLLSNHGFRNRVALRATPRLPKGRSGTADRLSNQ